MTGHPPVVSRWKIAGVTTAVALLTTAAVATLWWFDTKGLEGEQLS